MISSLSTVSFWLKPCFSSCFLGLQLVLFRFIAIYHQPFLVMLNLPLGRFFPIMADPCLIMLSRHAAT